MLKEQTAALENQVFRREKRNAAAVYPFDHGPVGPLPPCEYNGHRVHYFRCMDDMGIRKGGDEQGIRAGMGKHFTDQIAGEPRFHLTIQQMLAAQHFRIKDIPDIS